MPGEPDGVVGIITAVAGVVDKPCAALASGKYDVTRVGKRQQRQVIKSSRGIERRLEQAKVRIRAKPERLKALATSFQRTVGNPVSGDESRCEFESFVTYHRPSVAHPVP